MNDRRDNDLRREIRSHLELEVEERIARGMTEAEAERSARRAFGNVTHTVESVRAVWVPLWLEDLFRDLRYTSRSLLRHRVFTLVVVLTLGLGVGANTAIFSLMDQVLFRSLAVARPDALVLLDGPGPYQGFTSGSRTFSVPMFQGLQAAATPVVSGLLARFSTTVTVAIGDTAERATTEVVSGSYFQVLQVSASRGRTLGPDDDRIPDAHPVVAVSDAYWRTRLASDPHIIGRTLRLNGQVMTVVGVIEPSFRGIDLSAPADLFLPLAMKHTATPTRDDLSSWRSRSVTIVGRLLPGISREHAAAALNVAYAQLLVEDLKTARVQSASAREQFLGKQLTVLPGRQGLSTLRTDFSAALIVLMGMVALVLLMACATVANLLMARAASQQREVTLRLALGAGRRRIVRQRLLETLLLAGTGAVVGLMFAAWTTRLLIDLLPFAGAQALSSSPDRRIVLFALVSAVLTAIVTGLWPALSATAPGLFTALKEETASALGGGGQARARQATVVIQVALSVVLLVGAGIFTRSLYSLKTTTPGFISDDLLQFRLSFATDALSSAPRNRAILAEMEERLRQIPGVIDASSSTTAAMTGTRSVQTVRVVGYANGDNEDMNQNINTVGPGYFATLGIQMLAGREFRASDVDGAPRVAIVNQSMANYFWKGQNPIGQHFANSTAPAGQEFEVVGVVKDGRFTSLKEQIPRLFYVPYMQAAAINSMTLYIRHRPGAANVPEAARRVAQELAPMLPVYDMMTVTSQVNRSLFLERLLASLAMVFGALATGLAAIGLYGVMSFSMVRRTREIGIRVALGAARRTVLLMVLGEVGWLLGLGVALGLPIVFALSRFLESQLFGVSATDPLTMAAAVTVLTLVAAVATYLPARRAISVDPLRALRYE